MSTQLRNEKKFLNGIFYEYAKTLIKHYLTELISVLTAILFITDAAVSPNCNRGNTPSRNTCVSSPLF